MRDFLVMSAVFYPSRGDVVKAESKNRRPDPFSVFFLDVTADDLLGIETKAPPKKRGPQSQLEKQMAAIASLPRKEQQQLLAVVQAFITQHAA